MSSIQIFNTILLVLTGLAAITPVSCFQGVWKCWPTWRDWWLWPIQAVFCIPFLFVLVGSILDIGR